MNRLPSVQPKLFIGLRWGFALLIGLLTCGVIQAQNAVPVLSAVGHQAYFGGTTNEVQIQVSADKPVSGRLGHSLLVNDRSIEVRERELSLKPGEPQVLSLPVTFPEVKPGAIYPAELSISFIATGANQVSTNIRTRIWLFPADAFSDQSRLIKKLDLGLFDPAEKTTQRFKDAGILFEIIPRTEALRNTSHQTIVIGEGLNLKEYRGFDHLLLELAEQGKTVILFAPVGGEIGLSSVPPNEGVPLPQSMIFKRLDIIREVDKRLDAGEWSPNREILASTLVLQGNHADVEGRIEAGKDPAGWPWVDLHWKNGGRLLICGFAIVSQWETNPTPRYLLLRMLEKCHGENGGLSE
jgi:hypothetical protein